MGHLATQKHLKKIASPPLAQSLIDLANITNMPTIFSILRTISSCNVFSPNNFRINIIQKTSNNVY